MIMARRALLVFLLLLLVIGFAGHALTPFSGTHYAQSESTCAFHQGLNLPVRLQTAWNDVGISPEPTRDHACALNLVLKISHPPSL